MLPTLLAAFALSAPVPKPVPINLSWKFTKGDVFYVTHVERLASTADLGGGLKIDAVITSEVVCQLKVKAANAAHTELQLTFVSGRKGNGDSRREPSQEVIKELEDRTLTVALDAEHAVATIEGADDSDDPKAKPTACGFASERAVRGWMIELLGAVPRKTVAEGDTWTAGWETEPAIGLKRKRTEHGEVGKTANGLTELAVRVDAEVVIGVPGGPISRLVGEKQPKTVTFDAKAGRVRRLKEVWEMTGIVEDSGPVGAESIPMTQKRTVTIIVTDEKPKAKK